MHLPEKVLIREVGPRDGLQSEQTYIPAGQKLQLIEDLTLAGLKAIEVTSFVHPRAVPQLRDAEEVVSGLPRRPGVCYSALIANVRGLRRALAAGVDEVQVVISASEAHNLRNVNMTVNESLARLSEMQSLARGELLVLRVAIATAFGCPYEGRIPYSRVVSLAHSCASMGITQITLADTAGMANPRQVRELLNVLKRELPPVEFALHFHDTRGMGLANVLAGLEAGISIMESSVGGLGGCPFIPGATGNIATEDLVFMLQEMGIETGINVTKVVECARFVGRILGKELPGKISRLASCGGAWC